MHIARTRMRLHALIPLAMAGLLVAGCGQGRRIEQGDAAFAGGRPQEAVRQYEEALRRDGKLAEDPPFQAKLAAARAEVQYRLGAEQLAKKQWQQAIALMSRSLAISPGHAAAAAGLRQARQGAAGEHLQQARDLADRGDLNGAIEHLEQAAQLDPENADVRDALESMRQQKAQRDQQAADAFAAAGKLQSDKRLQEAADTFARAIELNPNHMPARARLAECNAALDQAKLFAARAAELLADRQLDAAIEALDASLAIWPFNEPAQKAAADTRQKRRRVEQLLADSRKAGGQKRWDDAVALATEALELYPSYAPLVEQHAAALRGAAEFHVAEGRRLAAAGPSAQAEREFSAALGYVPEMPEALDGLAGMYETCGDADAAAGRQGAAMLWYERAVGRYATGGRNSKLRTAQDVVRQRSRFGVTLTVADEANVPGGIGPLRLAAERGLAAALPGFVTLGAAAPQYAAGLNATGCQITQRRVGVEQCEHRYQIPHEVPNPDIPPTLRKLQDADEQLEKLISERWEECSFCRGQGWRDCTWCGGRGWRTCSACGGRKSVECRACHGSGRVKKGKQQVRCEVCHGDGRDVCSRCGQTGREPCSSCDGSGREKCSFCDGTGRRERHSQFEIDRRRDEVHRIRSELSRLPATVTEYESATWPYTVETFEKRAVLAAAFVVRDAAGARIGGDSFAASTWLRDDRVIGANPAIGLAANELYLPADTAMAVDVLGKLAETGVKRIATAVLGEQLARIRARGEQARQQGRPADALEADVDEWFLLAAINPASADRLHETLQSARQLPARPAAP